MKEHEPEVAVPQKPAGGPQLAFDLTEQVTKSARNRSTGTLGCGRAKENDSCQKPKEEYKKTFSDICLESRIHGTLDAME